MKDFDYKVQNGKVTIIGYTGKQWRALVPAEINGMTVVAIGDCAFQASNVTDVTLPNSIIAIGVQAFGDCHNLRSILLLEGITTIGNGAFEYCSKLASIILPTSLVNIGNQAFYEKTGLDRQIGRLIILD